MASVKMPESIPCEYNKNGWQPCRKPTDNGWCSEHENIKCVSCGEKAIKTCESEMGGLCCGSPLCATCRHDLEDDEHVTLDVYNAKQKAKRDEEAYIVESRTSPFQRIDPVLDVPYNLFELLKGPWEKDGYAEKTLYFLELKHGLMGFFPAVYKTDSKRIIYADTLESLECVWGLLEPRFAVINKQLAYYNQKDAIAYIIPDDNSKYERSRPVKVLTRSSVEFLKEESPFVWAFGLFGGNDPGKKAFLDDLMLQAKKINPRFESKVVNV